MFVALPFFDLFVERSLIAMYASRRIFKPSRILASKFFSSFFRTNCRLFVNLS